MDRRALRIMSREVCPLARAPRDLLIPHHRLAPVRHGTGTGILSARRRAHGTRLQGDLQEPESNCVTTAWLIGGKAGPGRARVTAAVCLSTRRAQADLDLRRVCLNPVGERRQRASNLLGYDLMDRALVGCRSMFGDRGTQPGDYEARNTEHMLAEGLIDAVSHDLDLIRSQQLGKLFVVFGLSEQSVKMLAHRARTRKAEIICRTSGAFGGPQPGYGTVHLPNRVCMRPQVTVCLVGINQPSDVRRMRPLRMALSTPTWLMPA